MPDFSQVLAQPEAAHAAALLQHVPPTPASAQQQAAAWVTTLRTTPPTAIDGLLQDIGLTTPAGIALMSLAEALLRIPDDATANDLLQDKLGGMNRAALAPESSRLITRLAQFGMGTARVLLNEDHLIGAALSKVSLPFIRLAVRRIVRRMGQHFVLGENISSAFTNATPFAARGFLFSYDMLGEGARTAADAARYYENYLQAIAALAPHATQDDVVLNPQISVKLSAIFPRYEEAQRGRVLTELYPKLLAVCEAAAAANMGVCIDAEEYERLELSLDLIEKLITAPSLQKWQGLGLAVQAYQTRAGAVVDWLIALAQQHNKRLMVRLVKGAYWDGEIKRAQERGLKSYPVFTRKVTTDVSYLACAQKLLAARPHIYPQFATHNALTLASIFNLATPDHSYEIQRLQGMGQALWDAVFGGAKGLRGRIYAPVGGYADLLTYLVRRLLENGANSNFVHQLADDSVPIEIITACPVKKLQSLVNAGQAPHPNVKLPAEIMQPHKNSQGYDLTQQPLQTEIAAIFAESRIFSTLPNTSNNAIDQMMQRAVAAQPAWAMLPITARAAVLNQAADLLEAEWQNFCHVIVNEGQRVVVDALNEIREATDFCRYYAAEAVKLGTPLNLPGPVGETNLLQPTARGVFTCIAPWNFPLAIFMGQAVAALVMGNAVLAKPAEQTPHTGKLAVDLLHRAGVPHDVLQLVLGAGDVGAALVAHPQTSGVCFTGSTAVAKHIQRALTAKAGAIVPLIAETGGINAMIVDSTALAEQVVDDVLQSAFRSAGQRCSALRLLCVQADIADNLLHMLQGALAELTLGDPASLATDVAPVIDLEAKENLMHYLANLPAEFKIIDQHPAPASGNFVPPTIIEIPNAAALTQEVFGPILHVVRFARTELPQLIQQINASGYGLTFGLHTRLNSRMMQVASAVHAGNVYVNRSMIGAVVGSQPFGGAGLSGTGPKAGGPHYLLRFAGEKTITINTTASGGNAALLTQLKE